MRCLFRHLLSSICDMYSTGGILHKVADHGTIIKTNMYSCSYTGRADKISLTILVSGGKWTTKWKTLVSRRNLHSMLRPIYRQEIMFIVSCSICQQHWYPSPAAQRLPQRLPRVRRGWIQLPAAVVGVPVPLGDGPGVAAPPGDGPKVAVPPGDGPGVPGELEPGVVLPGPTAPPPIRVRTSCKLIQDSEHKSEMSVCHLSLFECAVKVGRQADREAEGAGVAEEASDL